MKLSGDPGTFLLLCLNQLAADVCKRGFSQFALGDVQNLSDEILSRFQMLAASNQSSAAFGPDDASTFMNAAFLEPLETALLGESFTQLF